MKQELLNQATKLFDTAEKWNSFLELVAMKNDLVYLSFKKLKQHLLKYFIENPVDGWVCEPWGDTNVDLTWYLKDFGINSLALRVGWRFEFHLRILDIEQFDIEKMRELLKTTEFLPLLNAFENEPNIKFGWDEDKEKYRHYSFESPYDNSFDNNHIEHLAWFAFNKTDEFAQQVIKKVDKYRKTELSDLLYRINKECQK